MTFTQKIYMDTIEKYKEENHKVPTIRMIAKLVGVNRPSTVFYMVNKLKEKGYNYKEMRNYENEQQSI